MSRLVAALCVLLLGSCASAPPATVTPPPATAPAATPKAQPLPRTAEPPPPPVNLSGFPLPYRQGYADGCASATGAERKDSTRYSADGNYRTGWHDGLWQCGKKK
jgi:hypothetical protein